MIFKAVFWVVPLVLTVSSALMVAQQSAPEIEQLKAQLDKQQARIEALESALAIQQEMLSQMGMADSNQRLSAFASSNSTPAVRKVGESQDKQASMQQQPTIPPEVHETEDQLQRGPEIANVTPTTPALKLGPTKIRLIGYAALSNVYRSTNLGGSVATNFGDLPFENTVAGNTSEFRFSAQNTRLALRADVDLQSSHVAGYFEIDFLGQVPGNIAAAAPSNYGLRMRQAFFDFKKGKWEITGGQLFSLMTPLKNTLSPWPGDVSITQVIDQTFVAGLVWGRSPQLRLAYHYSDAISFGISAENPEQQVGNTVVFPIALAPILNNQYNVGTNGLGVPNIGPDFVLKTSIDGELGKHAVHVDLGGIMRVFRNYAPSQGNGVSAHNYAFGSGGNLNATFDLMTGFRFIVNGFAGNGAGRYIGGLVPDVIVRPNGDISPIKSYSWLSGFEIAPNCRTGLYAYFGGLYGVRNIAVDSNGSFIGWGYPGASNAADRTIQEISAGFSRTFWRQEDLGSVQLGVQYAYVFLDPWVAGTGPGRAYTHMVLGQVRYNLP